jgi:hypothetical protein
VVTVLIVSHIQSAGFPNDGDGCMSAIEQANESMTHTRDVPNAGEIAMEVAQVPWSENASCLGLDF